MASEKIKEQIENYFCGEMTPEQKEEFFRHITGNQELLDEFARVQNTWALASASNCMNNRDKALPYL